MSNKVHPIHADLERVVEDQRRIIVALESENTDLHKEIRHLKWQSNMDHVENQIKLSELRRVSWESISETQIELAQAKDLETRLRQYARFADVRFEACQLECEHLQHTIEQMNREVDQLIQQTDQILNHLLEKQHEFIAPSNITLSPESAIKKHHMIEFVTNVRTHLTCPISFELMHDPVTLTSGHSFSHESIGKWWNGANVGMCPLSRDEQILPPRRNVVLASVAEELVKALALLER